jgi:hypothetical protein
VKKVLIVSPHFPPVNAPDMQRTRLALPFLKDLGWEAVVLAIHPDSVEGAVIEPRLEQTYPAGIRVIRVNGLPSRLTRWAGIGNLWWRCGRALRRAGEALLAGERFDLVFFSTTQFDAFNLGPRWRRKFGVPFVLDYQDPWINDYYRKTRTLPPGGWWKFRVAQFTARRREPVALREASGVVSVSASYGPELHARYPWFTAQAARTIPFGSSVEDMEIARRNSPARGLVPFGDGHFHHIYAGRCGPDMTIALTSLFRAFKKFTRTHPAEAARHRFHFIGTDYAPPPLGRYWATPIAEREGVGDYLREHCYRVAYFDALHYIVHADALMVVGSNDPTYSASKIFPYLLARRPVITVAHDQSAMIHLARGQKIVNTYGFNEQTDIEILAEKIWDEWFSQGGCRRLHSGAPELLVAHTAEKMTADLAEVFNSSLHSSRPSP